MILRRNFFDDGQTTFTQVTRQDEEYFMHKCNLPSPTTAYLRATLQLHLGGLTDDAHVAGTEATVRLEA